jgi:hypothetical protein
VYGDVIRAGKHLIGEKPFGLDLEAFHEIERAMAEHPEVLVRCSSEFPFYPAVQKMVEWYKSGAFGQIIEATFAIKHSSDMDLTKPINWKRTLSANGEYGCMGDLGIQRSICRSVSGFVPCVFRRSLPISRNRPDKDGNQVPCETWDNAILLLRRRGRSGRRVSADV